LATEDSIFFCSLGLGPESRKADDFKMSTGRWIMHVDMDAFYAAIEQVDNPEHRGRPVIVGGSHRGVVSAASYEARAFGVHSAQPMFQARKLCPSGVFLPVRMARYREVSQKLMTVLAGISPVVEQVSIDEAYVDLTGMETVHGPLKELSRRLKADIKEQTGLTCSIGLAPNKFLAKIASDLHKPDGLTIILESDVTAFLKTLPVARIPGVGSKTLARLQALDVTQAGEILDYPRSFWEKQLGKSGLMLYERALGLDPTPVRPDTEPKSSGAENTLLQDTADLTELQEWLLQQAERVGRDLRQKGLKGRTVTVKVKYADFKQVTRSHTLALPTNSTQQIYHAAAKLLDEMKLRVRVRLIGLSVSQLTKTVVQGSLFPHPGLEKQEQLDQALDSIQEKFGFRAITRGRLEKKDD
jgi:DNA polymerase-4